MSLKPKKKSEQIVIEARLKAKESQMETKNMLPPYTMIVSEGTKTEPLYLNGFCKKINDKFKYLTKESHIKVHGTGCNTKGLISYVDKKINSGEWSKYSRFWLVYDKDDFPFDNFDNTQFEAEARKDVIMKTAWSNESVELWFLLHFQDYISDNGREQYIEILNKYFEYSKTREDLYDKLNELGSEYNAKRRAKKIHEEFLHDGVMAPSGMVPVTRMYELIEELESYLD